jgi:hypothetical protein
VTQALSQVGHLLWFYNYASYTFAKFAKLKKITKKKVTIEGKNIRAIDSYYYLLLQCDYIFTFSIKKKKNQWTYI